MDKFGLFLEALEHLCREHNIEMQAGIEGVILVGDLEPGRPPIERETYLDVTHGVPTVPLKDQQAVRAVECPRCGAGPDKKCTGARGQPRYSSHRERWDAWRIQNK